MQNRYFTGLFVSNYLKKRSKYLWISINYGTVSQWFKCFGFLNWIRTISDYDVIVHKFQLDLLLPLKLKKNWDNWTHVVLFGYRAVLFDEEMNKAVTSFWQVTSICVCN